MSFVYLGGIQVDCCDQCAGTWFDDGELEALPAELSERDLATEAVSALDGLRGLKSAVLRQVRYLACPVCGEEMSRRNYEGVSGIILNRCSGHGTWLDFTNGKAFLQLLADGRLAEVHQRARSVEAEDRRREIAQLERARLELEDRRRDAAMEYVPGLRRHDFRDGFWSILDFFD
jgi:Zn-finger nucleic acid-binding protein